MDRLLKQAKKMMTGRNERNAKTVKRAEMKKVSLPQRRQPGRSSKLPTDIQWEKIRFSAFDKVQRDFGHQEGILAGLNKLADRQRRMRKNKI